MQYLVLGYDGNDAQALSRRAAARSKHLASGDELKAAGHLLFGAAILGETGQMKGSMMVVDFDDRGGVDAWLAVEPYITGKVWERVEVVPCKVGPSFQK